MAYKDVHQKKKGIKEKAKKIKQMLANGRVRVSPPLNSCVIKRRSVDQS